MKTPPRRSLSILYLCLLAGSVLVFTNCGSTVGSRQYGTIAKGTWVSDLPSGYEKITVDGFTFYVHNGNYFIKRNSRFAVVPSPRSSLREKRKITSQFHGGVPVRKPHPGRVRIN